VVVVYLEDLEPQDASGVSPTCIYVFLMILSDREISGELVAGI
jgi:hypothetical protein